MHKSIFAGIVGAALLAGTAANAAGLSFQFDPSLSSIAVVNQGTCLGLGCSVSASLNVPTGAYTIAEGDTQHFDFADFRLRGVGWDFGVQLQATLAFIDPTVSPASTGGTASYGTLFGVINAGKLTWDPVAPITTADGSVFTVKFDDLSGLKAGRVHDGMSITVDKVADAVPEPASWAMMLMGVFGLGGMLRSRRRTVAA